MNNTKINSYKLKPLEAVGLLIIALFAGQIVAAVISLIGFLSPALMGFTFVLSFAVSFGVSALIIMLFKGLRYKDVLALLKSSKKIQFFLFATLLYFVSLPLVDFLAGLIPTDKPGLKELYEFYKTSLEIVFKNPIAAFIAVSILAPFLEEFLFRGLLLKGLLNNKVNPWLAIILVAFLFGIAHLNPWQFVGAGFLGIVLGFVYWRTKDLWICIYLHFLNNTISFIVSMINGDIEAESFDLNPTYIVLSVILLIGVGYLFYKYTERKKSISNNLIFATHNNHKLSEVQKMLPNISLSSLSDIDFNEDIEENGKSFEENAIIKAETIYNKTKLDVFSDDSGLVIPALNGEPGVFSARYSGTGNDKENIQKVLDKLKDKDDRRAYFISVICLIINGEKHLFEGIVNGEILTEPRGNNDFGYDPIFKPNDSDLSFAEMSPDLKNKISHRSIAIEKMRGYLEIQS
ncbi:RdgB/HAM1 family non-canonical purine NTP pyrophosphatase [Weeksellaceae bacterium TAE3-ERU29]|nr:RdgB/HAM1 family non-canonical purine NTP pyrophosphatase [Weeksellaceae bacterium TAE3-ERU29]